MLRSPWAILAAASMVTLAASASAQAPTDPTAQQNVRQSEQYEQALRANAGFRNQRIQKECGSIDDAQLHASCVASFQADSRAPSRKPRPNSASEGDRATQQDR